MCEQTGGLGVETEAEVLSNSPEYRWGPRRPSRRRQQTRADAGTLQGAPLLQREGRVPKF